jgi:hypothetical protein
MFAESWAFLSGRDLSSSNSKALPVQINRLARYELDWCPLYENLKINNTERSSIFSFMACA